MVLARFLPKNERFFERFRAAAAVADEIAQAFLELMERYDNLETRVHHIRELERKADDIAHGTTGALQQTFVTPLDREDIVLLAERIDDFVDAIEDAARKLWLYRMPQPTEPARQMAHLIADQAKLLVAAMPFIEDNKHSDELIRRAKEIKQLETRADDVIDLAMAHLYDASGDIPALVQAIRWGELYAHLEDATDRAQDVANALEGIALKNA